MHVCQAVSPPLVLECQSLVVDSQAMQQRGVQVMHVNGVFHDVVRIVVGCAMGDYGSDSGSGNPN